MLHTASRNAAEVVGLSDDAPFGIFKAKILLVSACRAKLPKASFQFLPGPRHIPVKRLHFPIPSS